MVDEVDVRIGMHHHFHIPLLTLPLTSLHFKSPHSSRLPSSLFPLPFSITTRHTGTLPNNRRGSEMRGRTSTTSTTPQTKHGSPIPQPPFTADTLARFQTRSLGSLDPSVMREGGFIHYIDLSLGSLCTRNCITQHGTRREGSKGWRELSFVHPLTSSSIDPPSLPALSKLLCLSRCLHRCAGQPAFVIQAR
jgi:hypothetical protein